MQPIIPDPLRGNLPAFPPGTLVTGQPAPAVGVQGGHGPVPVMVTPQSGGHSQAWGDTPSANPMPNATPGTSVFLDESGDEVSTQYNTLMAELWKDGIVPELRLVALMNFRTFAHLTINNAIRLLRVDIAMSLMGSAPDDYAAVARMLRPMVACEIPSFYDGFLHYGVTVANANLANVDFGGGALQAEMVFLPAQGALQQPLARSPQQIQQVVQPVVRQGLQQPVQQAVRPPGIQPPAPAQLLTSPPSPSRLPARRDIVPQHTVPRLVLTSPGQAQGGKQPAQSQ